jgi:hypothetical protein
MTMPAAVTKAKKLKFVQERRMRPVTPFGKTGPLATRPTSAGGGTLRTIHPTSSSEAGCGTAQPTATGGRGLTERGFGSPLLDR